MRITPKQLKDAGLRIIDIALACKVSEPAVYKWISKKEIPKNHLSKLQNLLEKRNKTSSNLLFRICNEIY